MPTWPASLPYKPLMSGFEIPQLGSAPIKSEMQSGKIRMRRQFTVNVTTMGWARHMNPSELTIFRSFVIHDLAGGTAEFTMPVWNAASCSYVPRTVQIDGGMEGISESLIRPNLTRVAMVLKVQAAFEGKFIDLDFANGAYTGVSLSSLTTVRALAGMAQRVDGTWVSFGANVPRITDRGLLVETARTNLLLSSESFNVSPWNLGTNLVTADQIHAPDGALTAELITSANQGSQGIYQSVPVSPSTQYTFSFFGRLGTLPAADFRLAFYNNTALAMIAQDIIPSALPGVSGWTRVPYTITTPAGCTSMRVYPFRRSVGVAGTFYLWGAQLEAGAEATSPIRTTTAALTRPTDVVSIPAPNGTYRAQFTFDDDSIQIISNVSITGGSYTIPTNLPRRYIKRLTITPA